MGQGRTAGTPYRYREGVLTLELQVQPGASRSGWAGLYGDLAIRLRLNAPPVDGQANRACISFLSKAAGVPKSAVSILRGAASRSKTVRIDTLSEARFLALKQQWSNLP